MSEYTADTIARITLAVLTEPGDPVTGQLVQAIGVTETLALIRDPGAAIPSQVDPVAGVRWRQQAASLQKDALTDELIGLTERHGLRILTPDDRFVIGSDPRVAGFTWVAGLGGHGMTTACAVGELGAAAALGRDLDPRFGAAFDPLRFA